MHALDNFSSRLKDLPTLYLQVFSSKQFPDFAGRSVQPDQQVCNLIFIQQKHQDQMKFSLLFQYSNATSSDALVE